MGYIYKITNIVNNKIYIGQTRKTIQERFEQHIQKAKIHTNRYLYDAMNHYGYENFIIESIEKCDNQQLDEREIFWIAQLNSKMPNGYNMTDGGGGGDTWTNNPHKEDISKKLSISLREAFAKKQGYSCFEEKLRLNGIENFEDCIFDSSILLEKIQSGDNLDLIAKYFGVNRQTILRKCKFYYGYSVKELRSDDFMVEHGMHTGGNYKDINKDKLLKMIQENYNNQSICEHFNISNPTLRSKCLELFDISIEDLRNNDYSQHSEFARKKMSKAKLGKTYNEIYGEEEATRRRKAAKDRWTKENNPLYKSIDKDVLLYKILQNEKIEDIANYFNCSKPTIYHKCEEYFGTSKTREVKKKYA